MSRKSWDGVELMAALRSGLDRLESRVEEVNALNVFPVPDGDTGTNMLATLKAAIAEGDASLATGVTAIDEVSAAVARGALLGARGNSGVLLSQILRGLPQAVRGRQRARATEIAQSLSLGVLHAYSAVATPTEGTILTVAREEHRPHPSFTQLLKNRTCLRTHPIGNPKPAGNLAINRHPQARAGTGLIAFGQINAL
jgi:dihydroxyacetone kinase-like predicted kinase